MAPQKIVLTDSMRAPRDMPTGSSTLPDRGDACAIGLEPRHDWTLGQAEALFALPFSDLIYAAQRVHRAWHQPNTVQMSTLLSIKTGGCPEDCAYCPQSVRYQTGVESDALMPSRASSARSCSTSGFPVVSSFSP